MADDIDQMQDREIPTDAKIAASRKPTGPAAVGVCHFCEAAVPEGYRWCNSECREDWDRQQRALAQRPR